MRFFEFAEPQVSTPESNLVTALELLRMRGQTVLSTNALINLVRNTDQNFSYDSLIAANESNPAIQNLIKNINKQQVELRPADEDLADEETNTPVDQANAQQPAPTDTVDQMAKDAAERRGMTMTSNDEEEFPPQ